MKKILNTYLGIHLWGKKKPFPRIYLYLVRFWVLIYIIMKLFICLLYSGLQWCTMFFGFFVCFVLSFYRFNCSHIGHWASLGRLLRPLTCFYSLGALSTFLLSTTSLALFCMCTSFLKPNKILKAQDTGSVCLEWKTVLPNNFCDLCK